MHSISSYFVKGLPSSACLTTFFEIFLPEATVLNEGIRMTIMIDERWTMKCNYSFIL